MMLDATERSRSGIPYWIDGGRLVVLNHIERRVHVVLDHNPPEITTGVGYVILLRRPDHRDPHFVTFVNGMYRCYYRIPTLAKYNAVVATEQDSLFAYEAVLAPQAPE